MAQNIYDDLDFLAGYSSLPRSVGGLDGAPEWPTVQALLPDLADARVLDLGCGFGAFCRWADNAGASEVIGLDGSVEMLKRARVESPKHIDLRHHDLEQPLVDLGRFDLVYSALVLHYLPVVGPLFASVASMLNPGGVFVCTVEHPIFTAPAAPGFVNDLSGARTWPLNHYLDETQRTTDWFAPGVVKHHRTVGTYATELLATGLSLTGLIEWGPSPEQVVEHPEWAAERERPAFLILAAQQLSKM